MAEMSEGIALMRIICNNPRTPMLSFASIRSHFVLARQISCYNTVCYSMIQFERASEASGNEYHFHSQRSQ